MEVGATVFAVGTLVPTANTVKALISTKLRVIQILIRAKAFNLFSDPALSGAPAEDFLVIDKITDVHLGLRQSKLIFNNLVAHLGGQALGSLSASSFCLFDLGLGEEAVAQICLVQVLLLLCDNFFISRLELGGTVLGGRDELLSRLVIRRFERYSRLIF